MSSQCEMLVTRPPGGSREREKNLDVLEMELIGSADGVDVGRA